MKETKNNSKETKFILAPEERAALIEAKYARARAQVEAMIAQVEAVRNAKTVYHQIED
jgi:hypothetical protein